MPVDTSPSEATEMYLITVYRLTRRSPRAATKDIATMLGVSLPSVSERVKRLAQQGYLLYEWREGAALSALGEQIAISVLRKHRLVETFLVEKAGYALDEIHDEACKIEHAISDRLANQLEIMLNFPTLDPHGHPIPARDGSVQRLVYPTLAQIEPGQPVIIRQVSDWDNAQLQYLVELGLTPGETITVQHRAPFDGPLTLECRGQTIALALELAHCLGVQST